MIEPIPGLGAVACRMSGFAGYGCASGAVRSRWCIVAAGEPRTVSSSPNPQVQVESRAWNRREAGGEGTSTGDRTNP